MKYLSQLKLNQLRNKTCLLRVDLNIPSSQISSINLRLIGILPTIKFLLKREARVIILSHRGRPVPLKRGISKSEFLISKQFSLKPFAKILSSLLKKPIHFIDFNIGKSDLPRGSTSQILKSIREEVEPPKIEKVFLLENLRFFPEEERNDKKFAESLASLGDLYVNDAFAVCHRKNASVAAITQFLPSYAGLLLEKEIKNLSLVMKNPKRPLVIVLGGVKISDKIGLIKNFLKKADYFLIGGGMANTFFAAQGLPVGDSLYEPKMIPLINLWTYEVHRLVLPEDLLIYQRKILDIGPETIKNYQKIIKKAKTIIWNGPLGYFEDKRFSKGTEEMGKAILKNKKAKIVIGGGETIASLSLKPKTYNLKPNIFFSTGGGAMLEYLAGKKLAGIEVL